MANIYRCDPSLGVFVEANIGNGHGGFVALARPALGSQKGHIERSLGQGDPLRNASVVVMADVVVKNAKETVLTVDVYQKDDAGAVVNQQSFSARRPRSVSKDVTVLRCQVEVK